MRELITKGKDKKHKINIFTSVKELPIERHNELKKLILAQSQIGDSPDSIAKHYHEIVKYISMEDKHEAMSQLRNLHNNLFNIISGVDYKYYCMAVFIYSIDGKVYNDLTSEGAQKLVGTFDKIGFTPDHVIDIVEELKKKFQSNFHHSFLIDLDLQMPISLQT